MVTDIDLKSQRVAMAARAEFDTTSISSCDTFEMGSDSSSVGFNSSSEGMSSSSSLSSSRSSGHSSSSYEEDYESDQSYPQMETDYAKLSKAIINGNVEVVKKAIVTGIDVNHIYDREQNYSFLHLACLMGQSEIVKVLLDSGAKTNFVTIDGHQAIDFIEPDDLNTISYMLKKMSVKNPDQVEFQ